MMKALGCIVGSLALVIGVGGAEAVAGRTVSTLDNADDARADIDIKKVVMERLPAGKIQVRTQFSDFGPKLNGLELFYDVKGSNPGPEYFAQVFRGQDGDGIKGVRMYRVGDWSGDGTRIPCSWRFRWQYKGSGLGFYNVTLAANCFQGKSRDHLVRTHVNAWDYTKYDRRNGIKFPTFGYPDYMGAKHAATGAV